MVAFGLKWFYSGKVVVFRQKLLLSGKMVVFGQNGCIRQSGCIGESCSIWAKVVVSGIVVLFEQK